MLLQEINNNNGPNGHLFYVGGDLMMRRGMLPIIMLPDGDLRIALHLVPFFFWIFDYLGECYSRSWFDRLTWKKNVRHNFDISEYLIKLRHLSKILIHCHKLFHQSLFSSIFLFFPCKQNMIHTKSLSIHSIHIFCKELKYDIPKFITVYYIMITKPSRWLMSTFSCFPLITGCNFISIPSPALVKSCRVC